MITQTYHSATQSGVTQIAYSLERPMLVTNVGGLLKLFQIKKLVTLHPRIQLKLQMLLLIFIQIRWKIVLS